MLTCSGLAWRPWHNTRRCASSLFFPVVLFLALFYFGGFVESFTMNQTLTCSLCACAQARGNAVPNLFYACAQARGNALPNLFLCVCKEGCMPCLMAHPTVRVQVSTNALPTGSSSVCATRGVRLGVGQVPQNQHAVLHHTGLGTPHYL